MRRLLLLAALCALAPASARAAEPPLRAGVGRADITPPTGYNLGGWTRADRAGHGVHTRLFATALVLQRGERKVALVAIDLFAAPGGLVEEVAARSGFSPANVVIGASHTHSGPGGFANFPTLNTFAPSPETIGDPATFVELFNPKPADQPLYTFLVARIAQAIAQADDDLGPAAAAWGATTLTGVTRNRSLEAHLADHAIIKAYGEGRPEDDPEGADHTIDPRVDVLRVDRVARRTVRCGRRRCRRSVRIPMGGWSMFANHGTVNPATFQVYTEDHHGVADRVFEAGVRRAGHVPAARRVVNVYGNGNEGDQSAGLNGQGPTITERAGRAEGTAMLAAWRAAGRRLSRRPAFDLRWTRVCFCGQAVAEGTTSAMPVVGAPFLTGSEEGRGPLFDITHVPLEDTRAPVETFPGHGDKLPVPVASRDSYPTAVPLLVVRVGEGMIATLPAEPTVEIGRRISDAVLSEAAGAGVRRVVINGLVNEYIQYLTTPEEYDRQHYEGASMVYGRLSAYLLRDQLAELARHLVRGEPAQDAYAFDPRNGVVPTAAPFGDGAERGTITAQPASNVGAGEWAVLKWRGGERGLDRPLDRAFVIAERRRSRDRWVRAADDLGIEIVWTVDDEGGYVARWEVPSTAPAGRYRLRVAARRYTLVSDGFDVVHSAQRIVPVDPGDPIPHPFTLGGRR